MKKQFSSFLLLLLMAIILPQQARAERIYKNHLEGSDCIYWEISSDGVLHIGASGKKMESHLIGTYYDDAVIFEDVDAQVFPDYEESPFIEYKDQITAIEFIGDNGRIITIGKNAFKGLTNVKYLNLNSHVTEIGESAFEGCTSLEHINYAYFYNEPSVYVIYDYWLKKIGAYAFKDCPNLFSFTMSLPKLETIGDGAFQNCSNLYEIPSSYVMEIGAEAFRGSGISKVNLPQLTKVGPYAFAECKKIYGVQSLGNIIELTEGAFYKCENLQSYTCFPSTLKTLGKLALAYTRLTSLTIPETVTYIEQALLGGCFKLNSLTLPFVGSMAVSTTSSSSLIERHTLAHLFYFLPNDDYKSYEYAVTNKETDITVYVPTSLYNIYITGSKLYNNAFNGMKSISYIELKDNAKFDFATVGAFEDCTNLQTLKLPASTIYSTTQTAVGDRLFRNCSKLTSLLVPSSITEIGEYAFDGCTNLQLDGKFLHVKTVKAKAFGGCNALTTFDFDKDATSDTYLSSSAFKNCNNLKHIGLNQVQLVAAEAFSGCRSLADISETGSLTTIAKCAFWNCSSLDVIEIPANVSSIYEDAFYGCSSLKTIKVNNTTAYDIHADAFDGRTYTTAKVYVPNDTYSSKTGWQTFNANGNLFVSSSSCGVGLTYSYSDNGATLTISGNGHCTDYTATEGEGAAPWSTSDLGNNTITKIVFDGNIRSIGARMFSKLYALEEVVLPNSVVRIGDGAFWQCTNLKRVLCYGNSQLESIGRDAFFNCQKLEEIALPSKLKSIGKYAFRQCYALTNIDLPSSLESIGQQAFLNCTALRKVAIPDGVELANGVFTNCTSLAEATLPSDATTIPQYMFYGCSSLNSIIIPASVRTINKDAFAGCSILSRIEAENMECPTLNSSAFDASTKESAYLYTNNKTDYAADAQWGQFQHICALIEGNTCGIHYELDKDKLQIDASISSSDEGHPTILSFDYRLETLVKKVTVEGINFIYDSFFAGLKNLETVYIHNGIQEFGDDLFVGCPNLKSIYTRSSDTDEDGKVADATVYANAKVYTQMPNAFKANAKWADFGDNIVAYAEGNCGYYYQDDETGEEIDNDDDVTYSVVDDKLTITVLEPNTRIMDFMENFSNNPWRDLVNYIKTAVVVFDEGCSVTAIPARMFEGLTQLKSITLPEGITTIGDYAFNGCTSLEEIELPSTVTTLGDYSFYGCEALVNADLGNCQTIGEMAFGNCTGFTNMFIPESMTSIAENAFDGCTNIKSLLVYSPTIAGADYSETDRNVLTRFPNTESLVFGPNVTSIGAGACQACGTTTEAPLKDVIFLSDATSIGYFAFAGMPNLTNVVGNVNEVGEYAFLQCINLKSITITGGEEIGSWAFFCCDNLSEVVLPSGLKTIGEHAFTVCRSLESIELPSTVTSIGDYAFAGCSNLKKVVANNPEAVTISEGVFMDVPLPEAVLYVPAESVDAYKEADVWKDFGEIMAIGSAKLADGKEYTSKVYQNCSTITYTRTFSEKTAGNWQCLYVPFDIPVTSQLLEDFDFAELYMISYKDSDGDGMISDSDPLVVLLQKASYGETLEHNTPYFVKAKTSGEKTIEVENATLYPAKSCSIDCSTTGATYTLTGTYSPFDLDGFYTLNTSGAFSYYDQETNLKPFRWYMDVEDRSGNKMQSALARPIIIAVEGEDDTTGIMDINDNENGNEVIYNLQGQRVNSSTKGIVIKNGKKYLVK